MKLLVTGADGFTGRHFVAIAQSCGHEVISLKSDLKDRDAVMQEVALATPSAVVHLAAISFVGHADATAFYDVNVIGTLNLLDALGDLGTPPDRVLLASSANVYGNCDQSPIAETQPPAPVNHYAVSKLAMEYMARTYLDRLPIFFVRPFNYTGPGQNESFVIPKLVAHFANRAEMIELGDLDVEREFNDVRFVCQVYLQLLRNAVCGETYNVCTGKPVTVKSVFELLGQVTGYQLKVSINPAFVRANEIRRLCGSPLKLRSVISEFPQPALSDTLLWMLGQGATGGS